MHFPRDCTASKCKNRCTIRRILPRSHSLSAASHLLLIFKEDLLHLIVSRQRIVDILNTEPVGVRVNTQKAMIGRFLVLVHSLYRIDMPFLLNRFQANVL